MWILASHIYDRRHQITLYRRILDQVDQIIGREAELTEYQMVVFLHDCFSQALNKTLKLTREEAGVRKISRKWRDYEKYVALLPLITVHRINPYSLFAFAVEQRRRKRIPPTIANIATPSTITHYLDYCRSNSYRVSTLLQNREYEDQLGSQLLIDQVSLTTYLLRKPTVSLGTQDGFLLSTTSKVLLSYSHPQLVDLTDAEQIFSDDLRFDPPLATRLRRRWNLGLEIQVSRVLSMHHELRDPYFTTKLQEIVTLLRVLQIV